MQDDKKIMNFVPTDPATFEWLTMMANKQGERVNEFAGMLLDELAMTNWTLPEPGEKQKDGRFFWLFQEALKRRRQRELIYKAAAIYLDDPTEDAAEQLEEMCDIVGLVPEEVVGEIRDDPFSNMIKESYNGTKMGRCIRWLIESLSEHTELPQKEIVKIGMAEGYDETMLNRAKRRINLDDSTPTIQSQRIPGAKGWKWCLVANETDERRN